MIKLVILDRDGVINKGSAAYVKSAEEFKPIAGSADALARLSKAGISVAIATNQSALGRGLIDMGSLNAIHKKMNQVITEAGGRIDAVFFCPHTPAQSCDCRKPKPGLILEVLKRFNVDASEAIMIGDADRDILAARAAQVPVCLVLTGENKTHRSLQSTLDPTWVFKDLTHAVEFILKSNEAQST